MKFEELRSERDALNNAVLVQRESLLEFKEPGSPWFRRAAAEVPNEQDSRTVRHLSTTASCLESLADVPRHQEEEQLVGEVDHQPATQLAVEIADEFSTAALDSTDDRTWESEGAARIYCRVRTLPAMLRLSSPEILRSRKPRIWELIKFVWERVDPQDQMRQGVAEDPVITDDEATEKQAGTVAEPEIRQTYPPNAFHSYWAIETLASYEKAGLGKVNREIRTKKQVVHLWAERTLAAQAALLPRSAQRVDAHQLAWAMATDLKRDPEQPATAASPRHELYEASLKAFFDAQLPTGNWPRYEPLFHYPKAGNAYCYTFETLTELLRAALNRERGRQIRDLLRPYAPKLVAAWRFAEATAIELGNGNLGWCSGHHPQRTQAEAWATAAVFSYLQALRRLIAFWTADAAKQTLGVRRPEWARKEALAELRQRGDTWVEAGELSAGRRIAALFLHPVEAREQYEIELEPDRFRIARNQGRSAILFGPPGTSKTTLVEGLAGSIGWDYVEIHASDFLRGGMDSVPAVADEIFAQLMELDGCVILFDEIDELIRERSKSDSDPFGRFLTTSMLPKIAKLWSQRRVLFFVATNHIAAADPAIRRSQRFDAAIFVAPPSFRTKIGQLENYLGGRPKGLTEAAVAKALEAPKRMAEEPLGIFALLRWDQMAELADRARDAGGDPLSKAAIQQALGRMGADLAKTDWSRDWQVTDPSVANEKLPLDRENEVDPFAVYRDFVEFGRRDYRAQRLVCIQPAAPSVPAGWEMFDDDKRYIVLSHQVRSAVTPDHGMQRLRSGTWQARDDGLLVFTVEQPSAR